MGGTGKQYPQNQTTPFQRTIFVQTYILMDSILNVKFIRKKCSAFSNFHVQFTLPLTNRKNVLTWWTWQLFSVKGMVLLIDFVLEHKHDYFTNTVVCAWLVP